MTLCICDTHLLMKTHCHYLKQYTDEMTDYLQSLVLIEVRHEVEQRVVPLFWSAGILRCKNIQSLSRCNHQLILEMLNYERHNNLSVDKKSNPNSVLHISQLTVKVKPLWNITRCPLNSREWAWLKCMTEFKSRARMNILHCDQILQGLYINYAIHVQSLNSWTKGTQMWERYYESN